MKNYEYRQHGRQKAPKPRNIKQKVEINNLKSNTAAEKEAETTVIETEDLENLIKPSAKQIEAEKNRIRQGKSYTDTVEKYGKEFAEALFFSTKK